MTKKDYDRLVRLFLLIPDRQDRFKVVKEFADQEERLNPNFSVSRFYQSCGLGVEHLLTR